MTKEEAEMRLAGLQKKVYKFRNEPIVLENLKCLEKQVDILIDYLLLLYLQEPIKITVDII